LYTHRWLDQKIAEALCEIIKLGFMDHGADYRREKEAIKQRSATNTNVMLGVGIFALFSCFGGWVLGSQKKLAGVPLPNEPSAKASIATAAKKKSAPITIAMKMTKAANPKLTVLPEHQQKCLEVATDATNWVRGECGAVCKAVMEENKFTGTKA
jgi:hypothetical protein